MRRQFRLPTEDEAYLKARELLCETIIEGSTHWLLVNNFPVPAGYNHNQVIAAVRIETGYPDTQLDMVYFYPPLLRKDSKPIGAISSHTLDGKSYQRWSRHRTSANPWRPGEDDISTHLALVEYWLEREFSKV